ncbi:hypothetical protein DsansV1_C01g0002621 [Dioscorea sansibarensis]
MDKETNTNHLGKIHFIDLAGYETKNSLFQLLNIVYALNANEISVPSSKPTHLLVDARLHMQNRWCCADYLLGEAFLLKSAWLLSHVQDSSRKHKRSLWQLLPCSPSSGR